MLAAGQQALAGALPLPYFLMIALFSFTIFGSVEAINDAAHILSVTDSVLDRLEELEHTDFIDKGGKEVTPERFDCVPLPCILRVMGAARYSTM